VTAVILIAVQAFPGIAVGEIEVDIAIVTAGDRSSDDKFQRIYWAVWHGLCLASNRPHAPQQCSSNARPNP